MGTETTWVCARYDNTDKTFPYLINSIHNAVVVRILGTTKQGGVGGIFLGIDNGIAIIRRFGAVGGTIALIVAIKHTIVVRIKRTSGLVDHGVTILLDTVTLFDALVGIARGVAKVHGVGNKISVRVGAAHDGEILSTVVLKLTIEGKAVRTRRGDAVVDGVWHTVPVEIGTAIGGIDGVSIGTAIETIDHTIEVRVEVSVCAIARTAGAARYGCHVPGLIGAGIKHVGDAVIISVGASVPFQAEPIVGEMIVMVVVDAGLFGAPILTVGNAISIGIKRFVVGLVPKLGAAGGAEILRTRDGRAVPAEARLRRAGIEPVGDEVAVLILVDKIQRLRVDGAGDVVVVLDVRCGSCKVAVSGGVCRGLGTIVTSSILGGSGVA